MSFPRVNPPGWGLGDKVTSAQHNQLDIDHSNSLDKTVAGDTLFGVLTMASGAQIICLHGGQIQGQAATAIQGNVAASIISLVVGAIQHQGGPTDWVTFNNPRSRSIVVPLMPLGPVTGWSANTNGTFTASANGNALTLACPVVHNGSTLASATISLVVAAHAGIPQFMPSILITQLSMTLGATGATMVAGSIPVPASGAAWHAGGAVQTFTIAGLVGLVDNTQNAYIISLSDESGSNSVAGNIYNCISLNYTNINDMRFA